MIPAYPNGIGSAVVRAYGESIIATLDIDEVIVLASWLWSTGGKKRRASDPVSGLQRKGLYKPTRAKSGCTPVELTDLGLLVRSCLRGSSGVVIIREAETT